MNEGQTWGIILAAGAGSRLKTALPEGQRKQFLPLNGKPLFWHCAKTLASAAALRGLIFVFPQAELEEAVQELTLLYKEQDLGLPFISVAGGAERQDSVRLSLAVVPKECTQVLVHDAARPFASPLLVNRVLQVLSEGYSGVVPGLAVTDTIKNVNSDGFVQATLPRAALRFVQTPQGFQVAALREAHAFALSAGLQATDDAALLEACSFAVRVVEGEANNRKITNPEDLAMLDTSGQSGSFKQMLPCVGFGYDVHRYGGKRPFILGGVLVNTSLTIEAHSDGDVLLHALMDALLGCIGAGDIGMHFPDSDPALDNVNSSLLLTEVLEKTRLAGLQITHVDLTVVAQEPRIGGVRIEIVKRIAKLLQLAEVQVNLKATTEEHLGFTGEKKGIKAMACVTGLRPETMCSI